MLGVGDTFERFRIEAVLGQGGMGRVFRAFDTRLERQVALKVVLLTGSPDGATELPHDSYADSVSRVLREARAAAALEHPHMVAVYDVGELEGVPYIAMELVRGETLRTFVGRTPPSWQRKLAWLVSTATALEAAHTAGVIHRDVKPENVMVRDDGIVKVLDFGIARRANRETGGAIDTATPGSGPRILGTPAYMAPETFHGQQVDGRADQFAWGVTAYELLTGSLPWSTTAGAWGVVAGLLTEPPKPLRARTPELPRLVEDAVLRALSKGRDARFPSMQDLIAAIEPFAREDRRAPSFVRADASHLASPAAASQTPAPPSPYVAPSPSREPSSPVLFAPSSSKSGGVPISSASSTAASTPSNPFPAPSGQRPDSRAQITGTRAFTAATTLDFGVDAEARFARFPADFTLKGMFFTRLVGIGGRHVESVKTKLQKPPRNGRYLPFQDYPQVDYSRIAHAVALGLSPGVPVPEAMRRLARQDFAAFAGSAVGRVSLALMGDASSALVRLPDTYMAVMRGGTVEARALGKTSFEITFRDFYGWVDCYPIGTLEGLVRHFGLACEIEADVKGALHAVYRVHLRHD